MLPPAKSPGDAAVFEAFRGKMSDLGYVEGKNLVIESRYAEGQIDRLPALDRFGCSRKPGTWR